MAPSQLPPMRAWSQPRNNSHQLPPQLLQHQLPSQLRPLSQLPINQLSKLKLHQNLLQLQNQLLLPRLLLQFPSQLQSPNQLLPSQLQSQNQLLPSQWLSKPQLQPLSQLPSLPQPLSQLPKPPQLSPQFRNQSLELSPPPRLQPRSSLRLPQHRKLT